MFYCSYCGNAQSDDDALFCSKCGKKLAKVVESRQVSKTQTFETLNISYLSADIKGSTEMMRDADVEQARTWVEDVTNVMIGAVEEFGGKVLQLTGDGLIAGFTEEPHGLAACFAAAQLQRAILELNSPCQVRVGIHSAVADLSSSSTMLANPEVKITQCVEAQASENGIQLSYQVVENNIQYLEISRVKNILIPQRLLPLATYALINIDAKASQLIAVKQFESKSDDMLLDELLKQNINSGERKIISSMFVEMMGSAENENFILNKEYIDLASRAIERYDGTLLKVAGNTLFGIFGAPIAYEDHALRACLAAYSLQQQFSEEKLPVILRIGLHVGEAVVDNIGNEQYHQYDALGASVNLAARMMQTASSNQIQLTEDFLERVKNYIHVLPLGEKLVKGYSQAIHCYAMSSLLEENIRKQLGTQIYANSHFVGREEELKIFKSQWEKMKNGEGSLLYLQAEPGVGKTRLVYEFSGLAMKEGAAIYSVSSVSYEKAEALSTLRMFVTSLFSINASQLTQFQLNRLLSDLNQIKFVESLGVPAILSLIKSEVEDPRWLKTSPMMQGKILFQSVLDVLEFKSKSIPILLVFEDLHWCDSETVAFLDFIKKYIHYNKILLILDYRPEFQLPDSFKQVGQELKLQPFSLKDSEKLLDLLLPGDTQLAPLRERILSVTEGNAFFMEEFVKTMLAKGYLSKSPQGRYELMRAAKLKTMPQTIQDVVAARIDQLPKDSKKLLQQASVLGKTFKLNSLKYLNDFSAEKFSQAILFLENADFITQTSLLPEPEYGFKHGYIADSAYGSLLMKSRQGYHSRLVEKIEGDIKGDDRSFYPVLAHHAYAAGLWQKALYFYNLMTPSTMSIYFPNSKYQELAARIESCFEQMTTLEKTENIQIYARLYLLLIHSLFVSNQHLEANQRSNLLIQMALDYKNLEMELLAKSWKALNGSMSGHATEGYRALVEIELKMQSEFSLMKALDPLDLKIGLYCFSAHAAWPLGDYSKVLTLLGKVLKETNQLSYVSYYTGVPTVSVSYFHFVRCLCEQGQIETAKKMINYLEKEYLNLAHEEFLSAVLVSIACYYHCIGDFVKAKEFSSKLILICQETEHSLFLTMGLAYQVINNFHLEDFSSLKGGIKEVVARYKATHYAFSPYCAAGVIEVLGYLGEWKVALSMISDILKISEPDGQKPNLVLCYRLKAFIYNRMPHSDKHNAKILALLSRAKSIAQDIAYNSQLPYIELFFCEFYAKNGARERAMQHRQQALDYFKKYQMRGWYQYYQDKEF